MNRQSNVNVGGDLSENACRRMQTDGGNMNRTRRLLLAGLAAILMAGSQTTSARLVADGGMKNAADPVRAGITFETQTALTVLCFPGAGCIVCHNGYCEYTKRT
jgi:hypothetical protein